MVRVPRLIKVYYLYKMTFHKATTNKADFLAIIFICKRSTC